MSVNQAIEDLASRVRELKSVIETEEATKTAFIIPFISSVLGYDVTDPREVIPEYTADIGVKKGEKVDFAIKSGEDFRFLIECKKVGEPLNLDHANQLVRYFNVTDTEFAILTNGEVYQFYAQLDAMNRMDEKPFMTIDLGNIDPRVFPYLELCTKAEFDSDTIAANAEELKYISEIKKLIASLFKEPTDEWVRWLANKVTSKRMTAQNLETFTGIVSTASSQFLRDEANRRLRSAQELEEPNSNPAPAENQDPIARKEPILGEENDSAIGEIVTTDEEIEGFSIIRAICCSEVSPKDVVMRDAKSYCAILYQDNNRKPIARLYFDRKTPRISVFDENKQEVFHDIEDVTGIYAFADELRARVRSLQ
ncbi:type I restriction endonuclease [Corynebacterium vitaeruminis]|uniref:type I restriction endonuclease n=1 Tax=Corynebacterium vitaeruminis TaxID=38305 RepID=UPI0023F07015|nr:type I restriction enzyme HsdR N-terminal domain-containing protein [Corynebacterium vitaeruminis]